MKNYFTKFILSVFTIILFSAMYIGSGSSNDCWVCEGSGENNCVVCVNGKTEMGECSFCNAKGNVVCTFCNGTGSMK
jgi:hypothetical protein